MGIRPWYSRAIATTGPRFHARDHFAVIVFLAQNNLIHVERDAELRVQPPHDLRRRHAAPLVEEFLRICAAEVFHGAAPRLERGRHVGGFHGGLRKP